MSCTFYCILHLKTEIFLYITYIIVYVTICTCVQRSKKCSSITEELTSQILPHTVPLRKVQGKHCPIQSPSLCPVYDWPCKGKGTKWTQIPPNLAPNIESHYPLRRDRVVSDILGHFALCQKMNIYLKTWYICI